MQETDPTYTPENSADHLHTRRLRRLLYLAFAALAILLLVLLPPLISVNRYQRRIASSISQSLGRPVHLDRVSLNLLPLPGFTFENFVVDEDPSFGAEPIIRAQSVRATLRLSSLWTRRVEFSTISFTDPSVNLVHTAAGKWNLESILLHAAHIDAAPTAQRRSGPAPRFPYIEATGARLNLKLDHEKTPISLTEADFALWLPDPQQWHLRLQAHPARTDTDASDTGTLQLEGTLGRAASLDQVPLDLKAEWSNAPLGEATRVLLGRDAGLRGEMTLSATAQGTVGASTLQTRLQLTDARRADFIPARPLNLDLQCLATSTAAFHGFDDIRCNWPPSGSSAAPRFAITGTLPDIRHPRSAIVSIVAPGLPAATLLNWLRIATPRVPSDITAAGSLTGNLSYHPASPETPSPETASPDTTSPRRTSPAPASLAGWTGELVLHAASLIAPDAQVSSNTSTTLQAIVSSRPYEALSPAANPSLVLGDVTLISVTQVAIPTRRSRPRPTPPTFANGFVLTPTSLSLGGKEPATLDGRIDSAGYTLHLTGMASTARLLALAAALPPLGDGLAEALPNGPAASPYRIDLTATRAWHGPQLWTNNTAHPAGPNRSPHNHP